ncbi:MAG: hypothetical protein AAF995_05150 [Planctomycetota bacterium]
MLIGPEYVILHLPKTGGEFFKDVLESVYPRGTFRIDAKHGSARLLEGEDAAKPRFMLVRDPWAWYPSWFHYCNGTGRRAAHRARVRERNRFFTLASGDFTIDCTHTLRRVFFARGMLSEAGPEAQHLSAQDRRDIDELRELPRVGKDGEGLITAHLARIMGPGGTEATTVGRLETMTRDFLAFLDAIGHTPPQKLERKLKGPATNRSAKARAEDVYTPAMSEAVAIADRAIIERFGYTVPDGLRAGSAAGRTTD